MYYVDHCYTLDFDYNNLSLVDVLVLVMKKQIALMETVCTRQQLP